MATRKCPTCKGQGGYVSTQHMFNPSGEIRCLDCKGTGKQHQEKKWVAG